MGRPKKEEIQEAVKSVDPKDLLKSYLKENKEDHYNFEDTVNYKVSTGSLNLDIEISGGVGPGVYRASGGSESGKTSLCLEIARNFLKEKNRRVLFIKCEGRLSEEMKKRNGLNFVYDADEWTDGSVFVLESNIYEFIINLMRRLVVNNPTKIQYMFVLDSLDGLILRDDFSKDMGSENRVAGTPKLTKQFLQKLGLAMQKFGHICALISQQTAEIKLDPYSKEPPRTITGGGGNAAAHWANFVFQFEPRYGGDLILEKPNEKADRVTNKILGHKVKITLKKSTNEKTHTKIEYPVKYGVQGGSSVWKSLEVIEVLLAFELVERTGAWFTVAENLKTELVGRGFEVPEKIQGMKKTQDWLDSNPELLEYLYEKFKSTLCS